MYDFTRKLITEWRRMELPFEGENLLVAVSGGADSCALALGLAELRDCEKLTNRFFVAHFNHKLRDAESDADAEFAKKFAEEIGFDFVLGEGGEKFSDEPNLEQSARNARYKFLTKAADEKRCFAVLTAHTQNDQAETLLLNLIRGSGIEGLSGMKALRVFEDHQNGIDSKRPGKLLLGRPLLNWAKREDTVRFTKMKSVSFRKDPMNEDTRFNRVRIRKELMANLKEYNPKIVETLANTAQLLALDAESLQEYGEEINVFEDRLKLKDLRLKKEADIRRHLRSWLKYMRGDLRAIDHKHIAAIVSLINSRKSGSVCELPRGEKVKKKNGELIFVGSEVEKRF